MSIQNLFKSLISTSTRPVASRQPRSKSRMPRRSAYHPVLETLEDRTLLSTIVWTNRGSAVNDSDGFNGVFGGNAALARNVVDYSLLSWQSVITSFNYSDPKLNDTYRMTVNMQTSGVSLGASAGPTKNLGGKPTEGSASIGRGGDTNNDNIGDGAGWFLDPTPQEHSEFLGTINNAFSAQAQVGSPAAGLSDLYSIVLHEFGHALGFTRGSDYLLQKEGKDGQQYAGINGPHDSNPVLLFRQSHGGDDVVYAQAEVHETDLQEHSGKRGPHGADLAFLIRHAVLRQMRAHEPDEVAGPGPAHPRIAHQPCGDEQGTDAEDISPGKAEADRELLLVLGEFIGQRGNAEHVVHREEAFDDDEAGDNPETGDDFLCSHADVLRGR